MAAMPCCTKPHFRGQGSSSSSSSSLSPCGGSMLCAHPPDAPVLIAPGPLALTFDMVETLLTRTLLARNMCGIQSHPPTVLKIFTQVTVPRDSGDHNVRHSRHSSRCFAIFLIHH